MKKVEKMMRKERMTRAKKMKTKMRKMISSNSKLKRIAAKSPSKEENEAISHPLMTVKRMRRIMKKTLSKAMKIAKRNRIRLDHQKMIDSLCWLNKNQPIIWLVLIA